MGAEGQPWSRSLKIRASHLWIWISSLLLAAQVLTAQVVWSQMDIAGAPPDAPSTKVALYYPTRATSHAVAMGPVTLNVAIQAAPEPSVKGLILLSHGTGGSELGHNLSLSTPTGSWGNRT